MIGENLFFVTHKW